MAACRCFQILASQWDTDLSFSLKLIVSNKDKHKTEGHCGLTNERTATGSLLSAH